MTKQSGEGKITFDNGATIKLTGLDDSEAIMGMTDESRKEDNMNSPTKEEENENFDPNIPRDKAWLDYCEEKGVEIFDEEDAADAQDLFFSGYDSALKTLDSRPLPAPKDKRELEWRSWADKVLTYFECVEQTKTDDFFEKVGRPEVDMREEDYLREELVKILPCAPTKKGE